MADDDKAAQLLERLLETTQDLFIFQALQSGMKVHTIKKLLRVNTDRVTRVSKIRSASSQTKGVGK
jgi:hypothetical protein